MQTLMDEAISNLSKLTDTEYTGRGIILGRSETHMLQIYWISGRSESSRNRIFCAKDGSLWTEVADPSKEKGDVSLLLYQAMDETWSEELYVVSNGSHTTALTKNSKSGYRKQPVSRALQLWSYEPDAPNFTQRITGICDLSGIGTPKFVFGIIRKSDHDESCERIIYEYEDIPPGYGRCITTYSSNASLGVRLPPFKGEPLLMPMTHKSPETLLEKYWNNVLNQEHRISIALKTINIENRESSIIIHNRFEKVVAAPEAASA